MRSRDRRLREPASISARAGRRSAACPSSSSLDACGGPSVPSSKEGERGGGESESRCSDVPSTLADGACSTSTRSRFGSHVELGHFLGEERGELDSVARCKRQIASRFGLYRFALTFR